LVVLRCARRGCTASKRWQWNSTLGEWLKTSYSAGAWFYAEEHIPANLRELADLLEQMQRDPRALIVRGELTATALEAVAAGRPILRRKLARGTAPPTLVEVPRAWVMLDIDAWPLPGWADLADDPGAVIEAAIADSLPEAFRNAEAWWQLSSSAGFVPGILKAHLFFWLSEPASNEEIKARLRPAIRGFDASPFSAAQPHYIAAPIIEGGPDPLPCRTGWRKGFAAHVTLPTLQPRQTAATGSAIPRSDLGNGVEGALAFLGDGDGLRGFHEPLRTAAMRYARDCRHGGVRDDAALKARLREAIEAAPVGTKRLGVAEYLADAYLDRIIGGAFGVLAADAPPVAPHYPLPTLSPEVARAELRQQIAAFLAGAALWHREGEGTRGDPDHAGLIVSTGIGKSMEARAALLAWIDEARAEGRPCRVLWLVPTHKLGGESLADMAALMMRAAAWRGRDAPDPDAPGEAMCRDPDAVADARAVGADIEAAVCGTPDGPCCQFRATCGYQRQKAAAADADVVVAPHEMALHHLPPAIGKGLGLIVMDEAWWQDGLDIGRHVNVTTFATDAAVWPVLRDANRPVDIDGTRRRRRKGDAPKCMVPDDSSTAELVELAVKARHAFEATHDGAFVTGASVVAAGLSADECGRAIELEWRRKREPGLRPGMTKEERKKATAEAQGNAAIPRRVAAWRALADLLREQAEATGRLQAATRATAAGSEQVIEQRLRRDLDDAVLALPMLLLDATMPVQIVRHFLPRLRVLADVRAAAPYQHVTQICGGWGKTTLIRSKKAEKDENARRDAKGGVLRDFVALHGQRNALVVTYDDLEPTFEGLPGVATGHFNAIAGVDAHRDVAALFVIGRPLPSPDATLAQAIALTGKPLAPQLPHRETRGALMADGSGRAIECRAYAAPDLEAVRAAVTDAEVVQAIGRGRGVNRTAENTLAVYVLADVVLPMPVERLAGFDEVRPGVVQRMAARGVVLRSPADAVVAYPDLFETVEAAKKALRRADFGDISLWSTIHRVMSPKYPSVRVLYRPAGRGQQTRTALCAPWRLPTLREWLEGMLGDLALLEMVDVAAAPENTAPNAEPPAVAKLHAEHALSEQHSEDALSDLRQATGEVSSPTSDPAPFTPAPVPPSASVPPPASAREHLRTLSRRLDLARPPYLWGDDFDPMREAWWRERMRRTGVAQMQESAA
jgi:hypothetical protein